MDRKAKNEKLLEEINSLCKTRHSDPELADNIAKLESILKIASKECINMEDAYEHYTPLLWAAKEGNVDICDLLIKYGAVIDKTGGWNKTTALMRAAQKNRTEVVELLCLRGANVNAQNQYLMTALMLAAEMGNSESVQMLLKYNADPNIQNADGYTALLLAAEAGHDKVVRDICQYLRVKNVALKDGIDKQNKFGKTPLIMAAEFNKMEVLKVLVEFGANINHKSFRGMTGLKLAAVKRHQKIVEYLCDLKADTKAALSMAAAGKSEAIVEYLRTYIKENNIVMDHIDHLTALHNAHQSAAITKVLIDEVKSEKDLEFTPDQSNTALMLACEKGQFDVVKIILNKKLEFMAQTHQDSSVLDSSLWMKTNKEGNTAMLLLASYYRDHEGTENGEDECYILKMVDELVKAPYFLDMLPMILPKSKSPNRLMNIVKQKLIRKLKSHHGFEADVQLVGALTNIAAGLALSAETHPIEARDLVELQETFERSMCEVMNSVTMDIPENVTKVLRRIGNDKSRTPEVVSKALTFLNGPLHDCLRYGLTKILATGQILTFVNTIFYGSLKCNRESTIKNMSDLFQLRSGCSTYRYCPFVMFLFEGTSKLIFVFIVSVVCITMSSSKDHCEVGFAEYFGMKCEHMKYWENALLVMLLTSFIYEVGEVINKINRSLKYSSEDAFTKYIAMIGSSVTTASEHFSDRWNLLDILTIIFISIWASYKYVYGLEDDNDESPQAWLSMSAISLSLGLLRFQSVSKSTGQLVIMVFEMINDLQGFLLVFLTCILGFGIAFHSLFPSLEAYNSWQSTSLTLFDAALGNHDFDAFEASDDHSSIGILLMMVYTILVMIVLLNLIIARMSATHEKIDASALEVWARMQAINTEDFILLYERNPMCMLPPPLNILSCAAAVSATVYGISAPVISNFWQKDATVASAIAATTDSWSWLTSLKEKMYKLFLSPVYALKDIYATNRDMWNSNSKICSRKVCIGTTVATIVLLPVWLLIFWCKNVYDILTEKSSNKTAQSDLTEETIVSIAGTVSDKVTSVTMSPVCALLEVMYLNVAIWNSVAPRWIPACISVISVIFLPVWACMFWIMIMWSIIKEDFTMVNGTTNRIQFDDMDHIRNSFKLKKHELTVILMISTLVTTKWFPHLVTPICLLAAGLVQLIDPKLANNSYIAKCLDWRWSKKSVSDKGVTSQKLGSGTKEEFQALPSIVDNMLHSSLADLLSEYLMRRTLKSSFPEYTNKFIAYVALNAWIFGFLPGFVLPVRIFNLYAGIVIVLLTNHYYYELKGNRKASKFEPSTPTITEAKHESMDPSHSAKTKKKTRIARSAKHLRNSADCSVCGTLELTIIRGNFKEKGESDFYRKINPYVVINYPYVKGKAFVCNSQHTKTYPRAGANCMFVDEIIRIHLEQNAFEIEFQVYDQDDVDSVDITHDELLYWKKIDIREWIANKRFEGDIFLQDSRGDRQDTIQVNAKIKYPVSGQPLAAAHDDSPHSVVDNKELFSVADRKRIFSILEDDQEESKSDEIKVTNDHAKDRMYGIVKNWMSVFMFDTVKKQMPNFMRRRQLNKKPKSSRRTVPRIANNIEVQEEEEEEVDVDENEIDESAAAPNNSEVIAPEPAVAAEDEPQLAADGVQCSEVDSSAPAQVDADTTTSVVTDADTDSDNIYKTNRDVGMDEDICAYSDTGAVLGTDVGTDGGTDYDSDAAPEDRDRSTIVMGLASAVRENESMDAGDSEHVNPSIYSALSSVGSDSMDPLNRPNTPPHSTGLAVSPRYSRLYHPSLTPYEERAASPVDDDSMIRNNLVVVYSLDLSQAAAADGFVSFVLHDCGFADGTIELSMSAEQAREIETKNRSSILNMCICHHYFNVEPVLGSFDPRLDDFVVLPTLFFGCNQRLSLDGIVVTSPIYIHSCDNMSLDEVASRISFLHAVPSLIDQHVDLNDLCKPSIPCADSEHWTVTPCSKGSSRSIALSANGNGMDSYLLTAQFTISNLSPVSLLVNPSSAGYRAPLSTMKGSKDRILQGSLTQCWEDIQNSGIFSEIVNVDRMSVRKRASGELYDCYLSYWWGLDERGVDVHSRVARVNDELEARGVRTCFNDTFVFGDSTANIMRAVVDSKCLVCFVTQAYLDSIHLGSDSHIQSSTRIEFFTAEFQGMFRGSVVVVVFEKRCRRAYLWGGDVGGSFSELLYVDLVEENPECLYNAQIDDLYNKILSVINAQRRDSNMSTGLQ